MSTDLLIQIEWHTCFASTFWTYPDFIISCFTMFHNVSSCFIISIPCSPVLSPQVVWLEEQHATGNHWFYTPRNREFNQTCSLEPIPDSRIISKNPMKIQQHSWKNIQKSPCSPMMSLLSSHVSASPPKALAWNQERWSHPAASPRPPKCSDTPGPPNGGTRGEWFCAGKFWILGICWWMLGSSLWDVWWCLEDLFVDVGGFWIGRFW